ncbi:MAG: FAD-dependent oxidoreductase [Rhodobacteraceae bacterium]|nr:FAD-dependent oxidoreductase [Paracoccaceae bacterium]
MTDFIIIGGGIAGISAAARLSELGQVTVLETEEALGYHASGRSAALFEENYGNAPTVALNRASASFMENANGGYLTPRGFLLLGKPDQADAFHADVGDLGLEPIPVQDAFAQVPILNPETVRFAARNNLARDIDTDRLIQDFTRQARGNGAQILTKHTVTSISFADGLWTVTGGGEQFRAATLVNAAGAWADQVASLAGITPVGIQPHRRSMARLPAPGGHDVSGWPMLMAVGETWYAKPDAGKLLVSPADTDPVDPHDAYADDMVLAEGLARYEEMVVTPVTRVETNWAGLRSFAPDKTLVLGRDPQNPSFVWSAGQGGYGFSTAPAASQLVADLVAGRAPELDADTVAQLSPKRFR